MAGRGVTLRNEVLLKPFVSSKLLAIINITFGIYQKLFISKFAQISALIYCIFICSLNISSAALYGLRVYKATTLYTSVLTIESLYCSLLALIYRNDYISVFSTYIYTETRMLTNSEDIQSYLPHFMFLTVIIGRGIYTSFSTIAFLNVFVITHIFRHITCFLGRVEVVSVMDTYRKAVNVLKQSTLENLVYGNLNEAEKMAYLRKFLLVFKGISYSLELLGKMIRTKILLGFVFDFCKIMFLIYYVTSISTLQSPLVTPWSMEISFHLLASFVPLVLMELSANNVDDIKCVLADQLLVIKDDKLRTLLYDALEYVKIRHQYRLWNECTMNLTLIFDYISLCSAYIIALLQFRY